MLTYTAFQSNFLWTDQLNDILLPHKTKTKLASVLTAKPHPHFKLSGGPWNKADVNIMYMSH